MCEKSSPTSTAVLVWEKTSNGDGSPRFKLNIDKSSYTCLKGKTYVEESLVYAFVFGCGGVGRVWKTQQMEIIDIKSCDLGVFYRRDLALRCNFQSSVITYINSNMITEVVTEQTIHV
tara:strand:+ start:4365 stop:4718 length:354 start_codon:yes stop_codon:yes gene_type:complete